MRVLSLLLSVLFSMSSMADLFFWDIPSKEEPILIKVISGGKVPPSREGWADIIAILPSGKVMEFARANENTAWEIEQIGFSEDVATIQRLAKDFQDQELLMEESDGPTCNPVTSFYAQNSQGQLVEFFANHGVARGFLPNAHRDNIKELTALISY